MAQSVESRANRAEQVRTERRKKPGDKGALPGMKLHIARDKLDPRYEYRFVADKGARVQQLYEQDYDPVNEPVKPDADGVGTTVKKHGGTDSGQPYSLVLMRKPKHMYDEDQKEKRRPLDEMDAAIRRGHAHEKAGETELRGDIAYTPEGGNTLSR